MSNIEKFDDPMWEYVLNSKLAQYIPHARKFWENIENIEINGTGVYPVEGEVPPGFMYRVTSTPVRSPIKHVQIFPFVPTAYLQITNVTGGSTRMVSRVCADNKFTIDEFTIVEKHNLPSTYHKGQFVAFVPTDVLERVQPLGKWVYLTAPEMVNLMQDRVQQTVKYKVIKYI